MLQSNRYATQPTFFTSVPENKTLNGCFNIILFRNFLSKFDQNLHNYAQI